MPVGMDRLADLDDPVALPALVALKSRDVDVILHLHWLARVLRGATSEDDGRERVKAFLGALDAFRAAGWRIVWTAHNVLPHDTPFPDVDMELRRGVVARAEVVHVLSEGTVAAAASLLEIPADQALHLSHPAYLGVYPDDVSDADARRVYGLDADDVVFGLVGHLRPYKGLDALLDAFEALTAARRRATSSVAHRGDAECGPVDRGAPRQGASPSRRRRRRAADPGGRTVDAAPRQRRDRAALSGVAELGDVAACPVIWSPGHRGGSPHVSETVGPDAWIASSTTTGTLWERRYVASMTS